MKNKFIILYRSVTLPDVHGEYVFGSPKLATLEATSISLAIGTFCLWMVGRQVDIIGAFDLSSFDSAIRSVSLESFDKILPPYKIDSLCLKETILQYTEKCASENGMSGAANSPTDT